MRIRSKVRVVIGAAMVLVAVISQAQLGRALPSPVTLILASRANGATGVKGNGFGANPAVSANGRFVAFESLATNFGGDTDGFIDIYVRDLVANTTKLVSRASGATGVKGNNDSRSPSISADGRFVAFNSRANNLAPGDGDPSEATSQVEDVFVRDLVANTTKLVSRAAGATGPQGNDRDEDADISNDGRFVAFRSESTNLHLNDKEGGSDIYVRDLLTNTITLASRRTGSATSAKGDGPSSEPSLSGNGRLVAFTSSRPTSTMTTRTASATCMCATSCTTRPRWPAGQPTRKKATTLPSLRPSPAMGDTWPLPRSPRTFTTTTQTLLPTSLFEM